MLVPMVEIREVGPDAWATWRILRQTALAEAPYAFGSRLADWQGASDVEQRWRDRLALPGSHNLLAMLDGRAVGMASGVPGPDPSVAGLVGMWVAPAARGRGVGDSLIEEIEGWARSAGALAIRLTVSDGNGRASGLYERNGFLATGEVEVTDGRVEHVWVKPISPGSPGSAGYSGSPER